MENTVQFEANFMRDSSSKWNLAEDVKLLKHLERFSESFMRNASLVVKCMDNLEDNLTLTYLNVRSVSNKFHSVGDTQFIENRAHDDDEPSITSSNLQEKVELMDVSNDPPSSSEKLDESLSSCIRFLEDKFETIQLSESDSEDEGLDHSPVVLKPHKCYVERPLPHIIGSYKFLNDSTLGLSLVLQENEDITETEDESGNSLFNKIQQDSTEQNTDTLFLDESEKDGRSIFSKVTQEETTSSGDVLNRFMPSNKIDSDSSLSLEDNITDEKNLQENSPNSDDNQKLSSKNFMIKSVLQEMYSKTNQQNSLKSNFVDIKEKIVDDLSPSPPTTDKTFINKFSTKVNENSIEEEKSLKEKNFLDDFPVTDFERTSTKALKSALEDIYSKPRPQKLFIKNDLDDKKNVEDIKTVSSNEEKEIIESNKPLAVSADDVPAKIDSNIVINKTKMPAISEPLFNQITPTDILTNLSKDRIKVQNKRRPPSRKARIESTQNLDSKFFSSATTNNSFNSSKTIKAENKTETIEKSLAKSETNENLVFNNNISSATSSLISPSTDEEDLFTICTSSLTSDLSSDRLFQPLPLLNESSNKKGGKQQKSQTSESLWDPFSEDDSAFFDNSSWSSQKVERSDRTNLSNLEDSPTENRLFMKDNEHKIFSAFGDVKSRKSSSLFDEIDDNSLFTSSNDTKNSSGFNSNDKKSHSSSLFASTKKIDFLNDPLGFNQDNDD